MLTLIATALLQFAPGASFDAALFDGHLIPAAQLTEIVTPGSPLLGEQTQYGMGLVSTPMLNRPFVWHNGLIERCAAKNECGGSSAFNGFFLDDCFSISLVTNEGPIVDPSGYPFLTLAQEVIQAVCSSSSSSSPMAC